MVCASRLFQRATLVPLYLLEHRDNRRVPLLQEEEHHECVRVRRQAATRSIAYVAHLAEGEVKRNHQRRSDVTVELRLRRKDTHFGKNLHDVTEDLHPPVDGCIRSQEVCVVQSLNRKVEGASHRDGVYRTGTQREAQRTPTSVLYKLMSPSRPVRTW